MYFVSNQEDYIVAASKSFLDKIGYRDICNISLALKNQQITFLEDDELKVSTFNEPFKYQLIELHSAFGKLNLYQLSLDSQILVDDENIEYLRKIKDGVAKSSDKNYDIPKIQEDKQEKHELEVIKIFGKEEEEESTKFELKEYDKDSSTSDNKDNKTTEQKSQDIKSDTNELPQDIVEIKESQDNKVNLEESISDEEFDRELSKLISQDETKDSFKANEKVEDIVKDIETETKTTVDKEIETKETKDIIKKEEDKPKAKKSRLNKIASRFFPWGSKDEEEDEIEFEDTPSGLSIANEIKPKKDSEIEAKKIEIDRQKDIEVEKIEDVQTEKLDIQKIETEDKDIEDIEIKDISNEDNLSNLNDTNLTKDIIQENKEFENILSKDTDTLNRDIKTSKDLEKKDVEDTILDQILVTKVQNINLKDNANKLSISLDNYKMLLENFLEEIENYKSDIKVGKEETISMLSDASRLLSLDIVTTKLEDIKNSNSVELQLKELERVVKLLKEKLNKKETSKISKDTFESVKTTQKIEIDDNKSNILDDDMSLPYDVIDITTAENLLMQIGSKRVEFDAKRASDELNLPESLIYEFVDDFIKQSKEHLNILVDAYNRNDIKTMQTTAHMLKGAASNLRLDTIANTLFKIQKESSLEKSGELLKEFVALLKGLEINLKGVESIDED